MGAVCRDVAGNVFPAAAKKRSRAASLRVVFHVASFSNYSSCTILVAFNIREIFFQVTSKKRSACTQGDGCHGFSARFEVLAAAGGGSLLPQARRGGRIPALSIQTAETSGPFLKRLHRCAPVPQSGRRTRVAAEEAGALGTIEPRHFHLYIHSKGVFWQPSGVQEFVVKAFLMEVRDAAPSR